MGGKNKMTEASMEFRIELLQMQKTIRRMGRPGLQAKASHEAELNQYR
jgi:hypothetical protein